MINVALIGAGKMGLSHLSILGAHPDVKVVGVCDTAKLVTDVLTKYSGYSCYADYKKMVREVKPDAVFVAVPTRFHAPMIRFLLENRIHVFAEKPFCMTPEEGAPLVELAERMGLVNQVGYHNQFVGTFREVKRLLKDGHAGDIHHFQAEAYGPVVIKPKQDTWRSDPGAGGGCLMDYASHVVDLVGYLLAPVKDVFASVVKPIYSTEVDDAVYALLKLESDVTGVLSVNWSDETYRKMSTSITIEGSRMKIISDASELKVYVKQSKGLEGYTAGWNTKYVTDLAEPVDFYLRGEEYSAQIDYFIRTLEGKDQNNINTFKTAWTTNKALSLIRRNSGV